MNKHIKIKNLTQEPIIKTLRKLFNILPLRRRIQLTLLFGLMLIGAVAEVVSLGAIVPFLTVLAAPEQAIQKPVVANVVANLGLSNSENIRYQLTILFSFAAITAGALRFLLIFATARINSGIGHEISAEVYRRALYQPYEVHVVRNSSEIIGAINKVDHVIGTLSGILNAISAVLMGLFIMTALLLIDPIVASSALIGFCIVYVTISIFTRKRLAQNSLNSSAAASTRVRVIQEGLGGIRDVLLDQSQQIFTARFNRADGALRKAQASINIIGPSPRFAVEAMGMVLISLLGYKMTTSGNGISDAIPTLGALALGAQRLMPLMQQIYLGWVTVTGYRQDLNDVVDLLSLPVHIQKEYAKINLPFNYDIELKDICYRYQPNLPDVIRKINLKISKGTRIGFIGSTGSGKSTLIDILMGLLSTNRGQILIDGVPLDNSNNIEWQRKIAHVPQAIFLLDGSFTENIAFGVSTDKVNNAQVIQAAQGAQIAEFIESSDEGYSTKVGERGISLSGGQRQRIGIARALYKEASVLVFDEATSALDTDTETCVMQSINRLSRDYTVFIVAHRLTTLNNCDVIYRLENGKIISFGDYKTIINQNL